MADFQDNVRRYIQFVLSTRGMSATSLAKEAGVAVSTLTRLLNEKGYKFTPTATTLARIAVFSGISPSPFIDGGRSPESRSTQSLRSSSMQQYDSASIIEHEVQVGKWMDLLYYGNADLAIGSNIPSLSTSSSCFYAIVRDRSINSFCLPGDYLFCVRADANDLKQEYIVVIEKKSTAKDMIEVSARVVGKLSEHEMELRFASDDPKFQSVEHMTIEDASTGRIRVLGYVLSVIRPHQPASATRP